MEQGSVLCQFSWIAEERYRLENQRKGDTSGVNKSEAGLLPDCFVDNWESITTARLHASAASHAGGVTSPTLKRLQRETQVMSQNSSETASHIHNLRSISTICMTKIPLIEPNSQIMSQC